MSDKPKIKRIPKADIEAQQAEREIQCALGNLRKNVGKFPEKVQRGLKEIAREVEVAFNA